MSRDVYDLDALEQVIRRLNTGEIQISEVTTPATSPFATDLLFGYVAEFMYATDAPLAERRASVTALDSELLGNLLGGAIRWNYSIRRSFAGLRMNSSDGLWAERPVEWKAFTIYCASWGR